MDGGGAVGGDGADGVGGEMVCGEVVDDGGDGGRGADDGHADAAVERFEHVLVRDVAELFYFFKQGKDAELARINLGIESPRKDAVKVPGDAAAGYVGDAVEASVDVGGEEVFEGFIVAGVGFEDGIQEGFPPPLPCSLGMISLMRVGCWAIRARTRE